MSDIARCPSCNADLPAGGDPGRCPHCGADTTEARWQPEAQAARRLLEMAIDVEGSIPAAGDPGESPDPDDTASMQSDPGVTPPPPDARSEATQHWRSEPGVAAEPRGLPEGSRVRYFGDYEVRRPLGRGGMGLVYEARQISLDRVVALKMIRSGLFADDDELRRFQNEAQAVARLDHPGIVPVYEVGEHDGQRYFSMKLVEGDDLARAIPWLASDPRRVAELLAEVAEAVHHAHVRGVLHRDLKPGNVLIDAEGRPHVTDFGLAKRVEGDAELTQSGAILGTPPYMSPEQANGHRGSITTATDVYGLGAILYALLAGRAPFGGDSAIETLDAVRTRPPEPPRKLNGRVPRDLETICLKCLEKDPRRRYGSAQALADDLRHWLEGNPIAARPVGPLTRFWMWCRRKPLVAGLAVALLVAVIGGAAGIVANWLEVRRQKEFLKSANDQISRERDTARAINDLLVGGLLSYGNPLGRDLTVVELLDRIADSVGETYGDNAKLEAATRQVIGDAYRAQGKLGRAEVHLVRAHTLRERLPAADEVDRLASRHSLGALRLDQGRIDEAKGLAESALEGRRRLLGASHPATIASANLVAGVLKALGRAAEAEALLLPSWQSAVRNLGPRHPVTIDAASSLAALSVELGRLDEAEDRLGKLLDLKLAILPEDHPAIFLDRSSLGVVLYRRGKPGEAVKVLRGAYESARSKLGDDHVFATSVRNNLAAALVAAGCAEEAHRLLGTTAVPAGSGPAKRTDVIEMNNLAATLAYRGKYSEAEPLMRQLVAWHRAHPSDPVRLASALANLAGVLAEERKTVEAERLIVEAVGIFERPLAPSDAKLVNAQATLAWMLLENGKPEQAESYARDVLERRMADPATARWRVAVARSVLGGTLATRGDREAAEPLLLRSHLELSSLKDAPAPRVSDALARVVKLYESWPGREGEADAWRAAGPR